MTSYEFECALVHMAEQIIKTFGKDVGLEVQAPKQEPKEPLIKDDGVREAVRAWAIANLIPANETGIEYLYSETLNGTFTEFRHDELVNIMFYGGKIAPDAIHGRCYTIDELCGEEGEWT